MTSGPLNLPQAEWKVSSRKKCMFYSWQIKSRKIEFYFQDIELLVCVYKFNLMPSIKVFKVIKQKKKVLNY